MAEKMSILIVDDISENIDVLKGLLSEKYIVKAATNGQLALKIASSSKPPDLIILDIMMPGMNGYEVCKRLKLNSKTKSIPVIFLSSKTEIDDKLTGIELGAVDYIAKPLDPDFVRKIIKDTLFRKRELECEKA